MESFKITQLTRPEIMLLHKEITEALEKIKDKYHLSSLEISGISSNAISFKANITGKIENELSKELKNTENLIFCLQNGLPENLIGTNFTINEEEFEIVKIETKNPKYPIIASNIFQNKLYKYTVNEIKLLIGSNPS